MNTPDDTRSESKELSLRTKAHALLLSDPCFLCCVSSEDAGEAHRMVMMEVETGEISTLDQYLDRVGVVAGALQRLDEL